MLYRRSGGRLGNTVKGAPVLLLDHVGRKSGRARTAPLLYMRDGEDLVIVASRGGSDAMPAWLLNLRATPTTAVQIGTESRRVVAREASAEEKAELWPGLVEMYGDYEIYQRRTEREIPVVILSPPRSGPSGATRQTAALPRAHERQTSLLPALARLSQIGIQASGLSQPLRRDLLLQAFEERDASALGGAGR
jgi:deazaflavin-dependent oxidoreductase (nitroreductase family)